MESCTSPSRLKNQVNTGHAFEAIEKLHVYMLYLVHKFCFSLYGRIGIAHLSLLTKRMCCTWRMLSFLWSVPQATTVQTKINPVILGTVQVPLLLPTCIALTIMNKVNIFFFKFHCQEIEKIYSWHWHRDTHCNIFSCNESVTNSFRNCLISAGHVLHYAKNIRRTVRHGTS